MKNLFILLLVISLSACTNADDFNVGKQQLENQGYTDIRDTGYEAWCCSDKDTYSSGFTAKDKQGRTVTGCICSGWLKGVTIRFQ